MEQQPCDPCVYKIPKQENLNIQDNIKLLVIKALNKFQNFKKAAEALKVSDRQIFRYKKQFNIKQCVVSKNYYLKE